ncbi:MAG: isopentenyl-diphosphate Delta-isomerase, partial [Candidatus Omnitrophica bacterium]|nr:isopentenyl-diphosphate Delta-isomerase [Candidatus Omnitrophota bacterium]
ESIYWSKAKYLSGRLTAGNISLIYFGSIGISEAAWEGHQQEKFAKPDLNSQAVSLFMLLDYKRYFPNADICLSYDYKFVQKTMLIRHANLGFILFPGGLEVLDVFFEVLCLIQTGKIQPVPIILIGREFWQRLDDWLVNTFLPAKVISESDLNLYRIVDDIKEAGEIILNWKNDENRVSSSPLIRDGSKANRSLLYSNGLDIAYFERIIKEAAGLINNPARIEACIVGSVRFLRTGSIIVGICKDVDIVLILEENRLPRGSSAHLWKRLHAEFMRVVKTILYERCPNYGLRPLIEVEDGEVFNLATLTIPLPEGKNKEIDLDIFSRNSLKEQVQHVLERLTNLANYRNWPYLLKIYIELVYYIGNDEIYRQMRELFFNNLNRVHESNAYNVRVFLTEQQRKEILRVIVLLQRPSKKIELLERIARRMRESVSPEADIISAASPAVVLKRKPSPLRRGKKFLQNDGGGRKGPNDNAFNKILKFIHLISKNKPGEERLTRAFYEAVNWNIFSPKAIEEISALLDICFFPEATSNIAHRYRTENLISARRFLEFFDDKRGEIESLSAELCKACYGVLYDIYFGYRSFSEALSSQEDEESFYSPTAEFQEIIKRFGNRDIMVVDVGAGTCKESVTLVQSFDNIYMHAFDAFAFNIRFRLEQIITNPLSASLRKRLKFYVRDCRYGHEGTGLADHSVDFIMLTGLALGFEYKEDKEKSFREICRVIKNGGTIFFDAFGGYQEVRFIKERLATYGFYFNSIYPEEGLRVQGFNYPWFLFRVSKGVISSPVGIKIPVASPVDNRGGNEFVRAGVVPRSASPINEESVDFGLVKVTFTPKSGYLQFHYTSHIDLRVKEYFGMSLKPDFKNEYRIDYSPQWLNFIYSLSFAEPPFGDFYDGGEGGCVLVLADHAVATLREKFVWPPYALGKSLGPKKGETSLRIISMSDHKKISLVLEFWYDDSTRIKESIRRVKDMLKAAQEFASSAVETNSAVSPLVSGNTYSFTLAPGTKPIGYLSPARFSASRPSSSPVRNEGVLSVSEGPLVPGRSSSPVSNNGDRERVEKFIRAYGLIPLGIKYVPFSNLKAACTSLKKLPDNVKPYLKNIKLKFTRELSFWDPNNDTINIERSDYPLLTSSTEEFLHAFIYKKLSIEEWRELIRKAEFRYITNAGERVDVDSLNLSQVKQSDYWNWEKKVMTLRGETIWINICMSQLIPKAPVIVKAVSRVVDGFFPLPFSEQLIGFEIYEVHKLWRLNLEHAYSNPSEYLALAGVLLLDREALIESNLTDKFLNFPLDSKLLDFNYESSTASPVRRSGSPAADKTAAFSPLKRNYTFWVNGFELQVPKRLAKEIAGFIAPIKYILKQLETNRMHCRAPPKWQLIITTDPSLIYNVLTMSTWHPETSTHVVYIHPELFKFSKDQQIEWFFNSLDRLGKIHKRSIIWHNHSASPVDGKTERAPNTYKLDVESHDRLHRILLPSANNLFDKGCFQDAAGYYLEAYRVLLPTEDGAYLPEKNHILSRLTNNSAASPPHRSSSPAEEFSSQKEERLILVDDHDSPRGSETKRKSHEGEGKLHRGFMALIFNRKGKVLITRRSELKPLWPGHWDASCCSHPRYPNETYEQAGNRRIPEELGIHCGVTMLLKFIYHAKYEDKGSEWEMCAFLIGKYDGEISPDRKEISEHKFMTVAELEEDMRDKPQLYTPWLLIGWKKLQDFFDHSGSKEVLGSSSPVFILRSRQVTRLDDQKRRPSGEIKAILFDLDGTLYKSWRLQWRFIKAGVELVARTHGIGAFKALLRIRKAREDYKNKHGYKGTVVDLLPQFGITLQQWAEAIGKINAQPYLKPDRKIISVLVDLQASYKVGMLTNSLSSLTEDMLDVMGLKQIFKEKVIACLGNTIMKPQKEVFVLAAKMLGVSLATIVMIGDSQSDIPPKETGMGFILVKGPKDIYYLPQMITELKASSPAQKQSASPPGWRIFSKEGILLKKVYLVQELMALGGIPRDITGWQVASLEYLQEVKKMLLRFPERDLRQVKEIRFIHWYKSFGVIFKYLPIWRSILFWLGVGGYAIPEKEQINAVLMPNRKVFCWVFAHELGHVIMENNPEIANRLAQKSWRPISKDGNRTNPASLLLLLSEGAVALFIVSHFYLHMFGYLQIFSAPLAAIVIAIAITTGSIISLATGGIIRKFVDFMKGKVIWTFDATKPWSMLTFYSLVDNREEAADLLATQLIFPDLLKKKKALAEKAGIVRDKIFEDTKDNIFAQGRGRIASSGKVSWNSGLVASFVLHGCIVSFFTPAWTILFPVLESDVFWVIARVAQWGMIITGYYYFLMRPIIGLSINLPTFLKKMNEPCKRIFRQMVASTALILREATYFVIVLLPVMIILWPSPVEKLFKQAVIEAKSFQSQKYEKENLAQFLMRGARPSENVMEAELVPLKKKGNPLDDELDISVPVIRVEVQTGEIDFEADSVNMYYREHPVSLYFPSIERINGKIVDLFDLPQHTFNVKECGHGQACIGIGDKPTGNKWRLLTIEDLRKVKALRITIERSDPGVISFFLLRETKEGDLIDTKLCERRLHGGRQKVDIPLENAAPEDVLRVAKSMLYLNFDFAGTSHLYRARVKVVEVEFVGRKKTDSSSLPVAQRGHSSDWMERRPSNESKNDPEEHAASPVDNRGDVKEKLLNIWEKSIGRLLDVDSEIKFFFKTGIIAVIAALIGVFALLKYFSTEMNITDFVKAIYDDPGIFLTIWLSMGVGIYCFVIIPVMIALYWLDEKVDSLLRPNALRELGQLVQYLKSVDAIEKYPDRNQGLLVEISWHLQSILNILDTSLIRLLLRFDLEGLQWKLFPRHLLSQLDYVVYWKRNLLLARYYSSEVMSLWRSIRSMADRRITQNRRFCRPQEELSILREAAQQIKKDKPSVSS